MKAKKLFIYLIEQDVNDDYDTYDSAIVIAENIKQARMIYPENDVRTWPKYNSCWCESWEDVDATLIGEALYGMEIGVICASFNAG